MKRFFRTTSALIFSMLLTAGTSAAVHAAGNSALPAMNGQSAVKVLSGSCSPEDFQKLLNGCCNGSCSPEDFQKLLNGCCNGSCSPKDFQKLLNGNVPDKSDGGAAQWQEKLPTQQEQSAPPAEAAEQPSAGTDTISAYEKQVVDLINDIRLQNGLSPLTVNTKLCSVARLKSQDMHDKHYFSHQSPTYGSPFDMMKQFGITYRSAGENIAMGQSSPQAVVNAWMNSEGHRANILNASFTQIGMGYVPDGHYWTQMFIG